MLYLVERVQTAWTGHVDISEHDTELVGLFAKLDVARELCHPFTDWDNDTKETVSFKITYLPVDKVYKEEPVIEWIKD